MTGVGRIICLTAMLLLAAGCTQDPAEVDYKGDEFFGRVHEGALDTPNHETFPEDSPRIKEAYARPVEPAGVQSVGVSDLAPPTQQKASKQSADAGQDKGNTHFIWPVSGGKVIMHFGPGPGGKSNDGINIAVAEGEPIWAAASGTVVYAASDLKSYGNMIIIRHGDGWMTAYAHARSIAVKEGDKVHKGDVIGYVGQSGGVKSPQLHFAIRDGKTPVDPELYLPKSVAAQ